jgi:DNA primase
MANYDLPMIKRMNNIIDVARELGREVKGNAIRCFYPENHKNRDIHPSLMLEPKNNRFRCAVCPNVKGDIIDFVCQSRNLRFYDALRYLADRVGITPISNGADRSEKASTTEDNSSNQGQDNANLQIPSDEAQESDEKYYDIYTFFFNHCSEPSAEAVTWLNLRSQFAFERLVSSGLLNNNGNLLFSTHRLIWTFFQNGKPAYFQGRTLDGMITPKELCLARPIPAPYNIDVLNTKPENIFICEGVIDTLTLIDHSIPVVGIVGTGDFKDQWISLFKGFHVKIVLGADITSQAKAIELVHRFLFAKIDAEKIYLPADYDVNRLFGIYKQFSGVRR